MKTRRSYLVVPLVLLAGFIGYFVPANARLEAVLAAERRAAAEEQVAEEAARVAREQRAREQAGQRARERTQAEAERRRAREEHQREQDDRLRAARIDAEAERHELRAGVAQLEQVLQDLRRTREDCDREVFAARHAVETLRIERRSLDLELQRSAEVLAERVVPGALVAEPLFPRPHRVPGSGTDS